MSMLGSDMHAELTALLRVLQSPNDSARRQAEDHLEKNWTNTRPHILLMGLAEQMGSSVEDVTRTLAAIIFRQISLKPRPNDKGQLTYTALMLEKDHVAAIRQKLLEALIAERASDVRNKISDAVAELARQYVEDAATAEYWPELLHCLFQFSIDAEPEKRATAYRVFTAAPCIIKNNHQDAVYRAFSQGFADPVFAVRLAAMEAFASFFKKLDKKSQVKYHILIPDILSILPPARQSEDDLRKALSALTSVVEQVPKMFKHHLHDLVLFCVSVIQDKDLGEMTRQNGLELLTTFADHAPSMCRKDPDYAEQMVTQCLSLMTDIGEDDDNALEWLASDDLDPDESDLNHVAGEQTMDRLANKLGGPTILAPTFSWLPKMMASSDWRDRHAALMAISAISEGCRDLMMGELSQVLDLVIPALKDDHPRVQWAGCNALGQMSTDFSPEMQNEQCERVLGAIIPVLDSPWPRVQSHAAAALVNFCEEADKSVLEPHLDDLLSHLFQLLQNEKRYVQEQALSTIATIADAAEAAFSKYYDTLMPLLVDVIRSKSEKEERLLRSKAMECATLIALAVGKERLGQDAMTLVELLAGIQNNITDADDPQAQYLMHCWGRICRVMARDFIPFLPTVMPPHVEVASTKPDFVLLDDRKTADEWQEEGWEVVTVKGNEFAANTIMMEERQIAMEILLVYAQVLEGEFAPYAAEIMVNSAIPGLSVFHDPVRVMSAKLVPQLLNCCKKAWGVPSPQIGQLWSATVDELLEVLIEDPEPAVDTLAEMYQSFYESVEVLGRDCLTPDHMGRFIDCVQACLEGYKGRVAQRVEDHEGETTEDAEDDDDLQLAIEDDQTLLSDMSKAFHSIFKNHGSSFLAPWARLLSVYEAFLTSQDPAQRQWGLCIMDDFLEYCGANSIQYASYITRPLIQGCSDASAPIRQAAAYGIGEAARCGGPSWAQFLAGAVPYLFQITQVPNARNEENGYATENACVAIAKILKFNSSQLQDASAIAGQWLGTLPVTRDEEGAPHAYAYLSELITQQHPAVLPQASKIFMHVAEALDAEMITGETARRVVEATKALLTSGGVDATPLLQQFPPESQQMIAGYFS